MSALRAALLGSAAGLAIALGGAPYGLWGAALAGPALLLLAITDREGRALGDRMALLAGIACGFAANALSMGFIVFLLEAYGRFPAIGAWPTAALLWLGQGVPFALASLLAVHASRRGLPMWLALALAIVFSGSAVPMIFPWRLGISQMEHLAFVQAAELGGLPLLDLLTACASLGALHAMRARDTRIGALALACLLVPVGYGHVRVAMVREARRVATRLAVGVVQPSIDIPEKLDPSRRHEHLALHHEETRALEAAGAELVVWPETSYPYFVERARGRDRGGLTGIVGDGVRGPLLVGAISFEGVQRWNSVIGVEGDGRFSAIADKRILMPFGEYVPLWDYLPPLQERYVRGLSEGRGTVVVPIAGARVGVLNCYEDLMDGYTRDVVRAGAPSFLANLTNDAWFGDTSAPHLHHFLARLRAVETRRDLLRVVNTGVSALVTATGEDEHRTVPFVRTRFVAEVALLEGATPWTRLGDIVTPACAGVLLSVLVWRRRVPQRRE